MPIQRCQIDNKDGYRWGSEGKCFTGSDAKDKATQQGIAIGSYGLATIGDFKEGMPHYTKDGKLYTGPVHKDATGRLMTGATHTKDSEYLYHKDELAVIGPKGGVKASPKAPKSDTPNKNPQGEGTAKGDASTTRGADVPKDVEDTLKDKVKDFNERYKDKLGYGINVGMLKSVYQRGVGAFNVSHSPAVKSSQQWAMGRVNAFLYLVKNGRPENKKYTGDYDLLPKEHPKSDKQEKMSDYQLESYNDYPEAAKNNAKRALKWVEQNGWGSCGTPVGKIRANQLANGENISRDTIARMASFKRQQQYKDVAYDEGCGGLMYDSWGGDAGIEWASRKLKEIDKDNLVNQALSIVNLAASKIGFDYDGTLTTPAMQRLVNRLENDTAAEIYIVSARSNELGMISLANQLGIPTYRIFATGSNANKIKKVKELGLTKFYDNNTDVIKQLPGIGINLHKHFELKTWRNTATSSNVRKISYNDESQELVLEFQNRVIYTYFNVDFSLFLDILNGNGVCVTNGSNKWGEWFVGKTPSVGAAVYDKLVKDKVSYVRGGTLK